jgi:1,2-phenylacetyl-CoA epoxidase catalytic subunit
MIGINYKESSYAPHARAADRILDEEAEHQVFALGELASAVDRCGPEAVAAALRQWLPAAANFFGPPGSGFGYDCLRFGLKARDNGQLTELYLSMLERRLANVGLAMPRLTPGYPHTLI